MLNPERLADRAGAAGADSLRWRSTADGSPSLWSEAFQQGFHSAAGALAEADAKFVRPAQLERLARGSRLRVVEVCVGLGYNTAALIEAAGRHGLHLDWWGLEIDPRPLAMALAEPGFRGLWQPSTLAALEQLRDHGRWGLPASEGECRVGGRSQPLAVAGSQADGDAMRPPGILPNPPAAAAPQAAESHGTTTERGCPLHGGASDGEAEGGTMMAGAGRWFLGDAREQLDRLPRELAGACDLVWLDAFSPARCPQLWSREFLGRLATLLGPQGRLLTYCSAAAVRTSLRLAGLQLASVRPGAGDAAAATPSMGLPSQHWSDGTVASPAPLPSDSTLRPLTAMEWEHLHTSAGLPYSDPTGAADAATILESRRRQQRLLPDLESTSAWRRRWGLDRSA